MKKKMTLFGLAAPIFLDMLLRTLTLVINTYMVSQASVYLVGAMAAGNQIFNLFITIFNFLGLGCSIVVAQSLGAKNMNLALRAIHISLSFNAFLGLAATALIFFFTRSALALLNVPESVMEDSYAYLHYMSLALFIGGLAVVVAAIIRVRNLASTIAMVSAVVNIIVIAGNAYALGLLGGQNYGLKGVAISSIVAQSVGLAMMIWVMIAKANIHVHVGLFFKFTWEILGKILKVGLPSAGENLLWLGQYMVAFSFVAMLGAASLAVQAIYFQISMFIFLASSSIAMANEVIVGHLVGASRFNEAFARTLKSLKIGIGITWFVLAVFFLTREQIMTALNLTEDIKAIMRPLFTLSLVLESGRGFNIIMVSALRAAGDARFPFIAGAVFMWCVSLPVGYFLGIVMGYGIVGVWAGFCCDEWLRGIANTWRWYSGKWKSKKLV